MGKEAAVDSKLWDDARFDKLWLYNLHYFDDLNARRSHDRRSWHHSLIASWIEDNPPGFGIGWDPYPTSLRIVNWIKAACRGLALSSSAQQSLSVQTRWLRQRVERHLLGNHLLANAKALIFSGIYFSGKEADQWLQFGERVLTKQIKEQILDDGGHFELSPMYQATVIEDVLDLINLYQAYDLPTPTLLSSKIGPMVQWLASMCHPDGEISFFNDSAFGVAPRLVELRDYAERLGFDIPVDPIECEDLPDSGYIRLVGPGSVVLIDTAPLGPDYLPAHGHADTLSFEVSLEGRRILVNSGTSTYQVSPERFQERGTAAHNTIVVDERDSSEVWSAFRVGRRAKILERACDFQSFPLVAEGAHDGYRHLAGSVVHRRKWSLDQSVLEINDEIVGKGNHEYAIHFHLHPNFTAQKVGTRSLRLYGGENIPAPTLDIEGPGVMTVEQDAWHPRFHTSIPAEQVILRYSGPCPVSWVTRIYW